MSNFDAGRLATAKASRVGTAALGQWYGQSYSAKDPTWSTAGASLENLEVVRDVSGATDYAYEGDRATSLSGAMSASLTYDYAGRAVTRTAGTAVEVFTHDALDRLVKVSRGTAEELLEYGPTGEPVFRKLGTRGTWYVGSVGTVTADVAVGCKGIDVDLVTLADRCSPLTGTVKVAAHVQVAGGRVASINAAAGTGPDPVASVLYYHRDLQGSVVATTTRSGGLSGAMGARYRYTPYGQLDRTENVTALSDSELGYTGGLRLGYVAGSPQVGSLLLLGARVYHAELKRWLVPDTVDGRRYTYAGGDPVNFVDPSGRAAAPLPGIYVGGMHFGNNSMQARWYYEFLTGGGGSGSSWNFMLGELLIDARVDLAAMHLGRLADFEALPFKTRQAVIDILKTGGKYAKQWAADYLVPVKSSELLADLILRLYEGALGFQHIGIGVVASGAPVGVGTTFGKYPAVTTGLGLMMGVGVDVPSEIRADSGVQLAEWRIPTTPAQDRAVLQRIEELGGLRLDYNLYHANCAGFVGDVLGAAGVRFAATGLPVYFMNQFTGSDEPWRMGYHP